VGRGGRKGWGKGEGGWRELPSEAMAAMTAEGEPSSPNQGFGASGDEELLRRRL